MHTLILHKSHMNAYLLRAGFVLMSVLAVWFNPSHKPMINVWLGIVLLFLTLWPLDRWLASGHQRKIPVLEFYLLFYAVSMGIPALLINPSRLMLLRYRVDEHAFTIGLIAAIISVTATLLGYALGRRRGGHLMQRLAPRFPAGGGGFAVVILYPLLLIATLVTQQFHIGALAQIAPALRLFVFTWALCAAWSDGMPRPIARIALFIILPVEFVLFSQLLQGYLTGFLVYGELIGICYAVTHKKVPVAIVLAVIALYFALQPVKARYRDVTWHGNTELTSTQKLALLTQTSTTNAEDAASDEGVTESLQQSYARINHLLDISAVIKSVSLTERYWNGRTLIPLATKWIPRFLWPGKPKDDIANSYGRRLGFLDPGDYVTALNLPWLAEMFLNFGWTGVVFMSVMIGWLIGALKRGIVDVVKSPVEIAFAISIASVFFWPESNLSLRIGGMIIAWISISVLLVGVRMLFKTELLGGRVANA